MTEHRRNLKVKKYQKVCWSRKPTEGSPHLHIVTTHGYNDTEDELFCFWATGWKQLIHRCDTFDFNFETSTKEESNGKRWNVIDLDSLIVRNSRDEEVKRGLGKVEPGKKYGFSTKGKGRKYAYNFGL
tara:strand:- start:35 stop:418 length:384 start_codon:yes stop_codon:yes gene_type:complete